MESLAECGMKHPELRLSMDIETWLGEQLLKVKVYDASYNTLAAQDYVMIDGTEDEPDVLEQTVDKAVAEMQKQDAENKEEVESTTNTK